MKVKSESEVAQSCPTLRHPMDCSLPGSSVHGSFQARVLEWGAIASSTISANWFQRCQCSLLPSPARQHPFTLIHGPNVPGSCPILFFTALDFTFITRHIHTCTSFPLWPGHFILSRTVSSCPPFFPSSILDTFQPGGLIFRCHIFLPFYTVHWILTATILGWFAIPSSSGSCFVRILHHDPSVFGGPVHPSS